MRWRDEKWYVLGWNLSSARVLTHPPATQLPRPSIVRSLHTTFTADLVFFLLRRWMSWSLSGAFEFNVLLAFYRPIGRTCWSVTLHTPLPVVTRSFLLREMTLLLSTFPPTGPWHRNLCSLALAPPRLLQQIWEDDPQDGPVYLSKWDISDAFHRCVLRPSDVGAFSYFVMPLPSNTAIYLCLGLVLPMGWVSSPP